MKLIRGEIIISKRKNDVVTSVAKCLTNYSKTPFQIPSSFNNIVLLSNPHSKRVGGYFGLAMPTLV